MKFDSKMEIIEHLYEIKENFQENIQNINDDYLNYVFDLTEKIIPKSKYFDIDVKELSEDLTDVIFERYSEVASEMCRAVRNLN